IAEDLVAREPWDRANIERFRDALTLLGETDVDAVIADRLSGQSPFVSTQALWPPPAAEPAAEGRRVTPAAAHAIDLGSILAEEHDEPEVATATEGHESPEVDLSSILGGM